MTEIERKALTLLNEVRKERCFKPISDPFRSTSDPFETLCRALEQHEAFRQEVSDAVEAYLGHNAPWPDNSLRRFILPKPVDPLVEAWIEATGNTVGMEPLNEAIEKRGGKITWGEG